MFSASAEFRSLPGSVRPGVEAVVRPNFGQLEHVRKAECSTTRVKQVRSLSTRLLIDRQNYPAICELVTSLTTTADDGGQKSGGLSIRQHDGSRERRVPLFPARFRSLRRTATDVDASGRPRVAGSLPLSGVIPRYCDGFRRAGGFFSRLISGRRSSICPTRGRNVSRGDVA